jgi:Family of unknown function (DUF5522)
MEGSSPYIPPGIDVASLSPSDYFYAGPYLVLTPSYYRKRGECCGSGCRHCPFRDLPEQDETSE